MRRGATAMTFLGGVLLLAAAARAEAPGAAVVAKELEPARFLLGEWRAEGGGTPGEASGEFTFAVQLQGRVIVRTNSADYPAAAGKPAYRHDDLMILYAGDGGALRADYYDSEGHVIRYAAAATPDGGLTFTSEAAAGAPRFRLSYSVEADGRLKGAFAIAPPGKAEAFAPYLAWTARRKKG